MVAASHADNDTGSQTAGFDPWIAALAIAAFASDDWAMVSPVPDRNPDDCPRCALRLDRFPAISRTDDQTPICSACGRDEALRAWAGEPLPEQRDWPLAADAEHPVPPFSGPGILHLARCWRCRIRYLGQ